MCYRVKLSMELSYHVVKISPASAFSLESNGVSCAHTGSVDKPTYIAARESYILQF